MILSMGWERLVTTVWGKNRNCRVEQTILWVVIGKGLAGQPPRRPRPTELVSEDEELECVPQAEEGPRSRRVGQGCKK